jgi:hypothetical protein
VITTGEPDECEGGQGDAIVVVSGVDGVVTVFDEKAADAPDVTVVLVVVVSAAFS